MTRADADDDRLFQSGLPAWAVIERFRYLGSTSRDHTLVELELLVTLTDGRRHGVRHRGMIPLTRVDRVQQGARVAVRVDPVDPRLLVVDWAG